MCESSHSECQANRNSFKFKFAVGEKNIGENPGIDVHVKAHVGPVHSKSVLESQLKPATGGRLDQFKLVIKVPVGSAAESLKPKAESAIEFMANMGVPIFEIIGKPTVEVDAEGLYVVFQAPEETKKMIAGKMGAAMFLSDNVKKLEGEVNLCLKIASDANKLFSELKEGRPPIKEALRGLCLGLCLNGNRDILRLIVQDLSKLIPDVFKPVCVPAYLFHCAKVELNLDSSEELSPEVLNNFPFPIPQVPNANDLAPMAEILKFKQEVGQSMTGGLQIFLATKMFAAQVTLNAKNLTQVLGSFLA